MKISINGRIIETKDIYKIGKIETGHYDTSEEVRWFVKTDTKPRYGSLTNRCIIKFYNDKKIKIESKSIEKVEKLRQSIVDIWSNSQSDIPSFEIN